MKKILLLLLLCLPIINYAQSLLPEPYPEPPSNANYYYQNLGQIIDHNGTTRNDVLYYSEKGYPKTFFLQDRVAFTSFSMGDTSITNAQDTLRRIDLKFICDPKSMRSACASVRAYETSQDVLNYYLPHCPNGITDVPGYARIVYENAYPDIDVHFYSNNSGMKMFFVVKPGGDPNSILLLFSGQDSISQITNTGLRMYLDSWIMQFPQAIAYEIDNNNNTSMLSWQPTWQHQMGGQVNLITGSYNTSNTLVIAIGSVSPTPTAIANLDWSVYYGGEFEQKDGQICEGNNGNIYHALSTFGQENTFPGLSGQLNASQGYYDWYISRFQNTVRRWATYFGGAQQDRVTAIKSYYKGTYSEDLGEIWVSGYTTSNNVPAGSSPAGGFQQAKDAGMGQSAQPNSKFDGLICSFDSEIGYRKYTTYFGGTTDDYINNMYIDIPRNRLYIVGNTKGNGNYSGGCTAQTNGSFPLCSGNGYYYKNSRCQTDREDGFIAQFNMANMSLSWSTLFGGSGQDNIQSITVKDDQVYIGGQTWNNAGNLSESPSPTTTHNSCSFPLSNPGNGAFFQNSNNDLNKNMFISVFGPDRKLSWSTLCGFSVDGITDIAFNSNGDLLCLGSYSTTDRYASSSALPNGLGLTPTYNNGLSYFETVSGSRPSNTLMKFSTQKQLLWSTPLHFSSGNDLNTTNINRQRLSHLLINDQNRIFIATTIDDISVPVLQVASCYWQPQNGSTTTPGGNAPFDNYILSLDRNEQLNWATYFGGGDADPNGYVTDVPTGITYQEPYLYLTGMTRCVNSPYNQCITSIPNSYCDQTYYMGSQQASFTFDNFISRFRTDLLPTGLSSKENITDCTMYPNPTTSTTYVQFVCKSKLPVSLIITDVTGKQITNSTYTCKAGSNILGLDLTGLTAGNYFVQLKGDHINITKKIIKL